jgi:phosphate transport system substrate-binding protein
VAQLRNAAGKWISPSPEATSAAIAAFKEQLSKDVRSSIVNPPASAPQAYPISGLTYLLIPKQPKDTAKGQVLNKFVLYILNQGQDLAVGMNYAKLPPELQQLDKQLLGQVAGGSANPGGQ